MGFFSCIVPIPLPDFVVGVASRSLPGTRPGEATATQTLLACGLGLRSLTGADGLSSLEVGPPLQLFVDPAAPDGGDPATARRPYTCTTGFASPVWDPFSSAVYLREGTAIVRLASDNTVTVVARDVLRTGLSVPKRLVSDGAGSLYVAEGCGIRQLQLQGLVPGAAGTEGEVLVSTLPVLAADEILGLAFDSGSSSRNESSSNESISSNGNSSGSLLFATSSALYRLPLGDPHAAPLLVAGAEGQHGDVDGHGAGATFNSIWGIVVDGEGCVYMADHNDEDETEVRRVAADGAVTTVAAGLQDDLILHGILPNGCLVLREDDGAALHVLSLGLKLPQGDAAAAPLRPAGPTPGTLPADLGALLRRQPDATADVTIVVGGRTFHAHRALLSARSGYFRQRFEGGFAEGSAQQLSLPDADPDAFELVLRWVYTDAADFTVEQAAGVAELADRLLLPGLCERASAVVEASLSAVTIVGLLLWAEARGPAFSGLLSRLKSWYVENHEAVIREAKEEVRLLAARSLDLFFELTCELPSRRPRTTR